MSDKENFTFTTVRGVVLDEQVRVKTSVYGNIGTSGAGYTSGSIDSTTREEQQFWLQKDDGQELHVDIRQINGTLPVRKGHNVILAYYEKRKMPSALYIENTKQSYLITHSHEDAKFGPKKIALYISASILLFLVLAVICAIIGTPLGYFIGTYIVAFCITSIFFFQKRSSETGLRKQREKQIADDAERHIYRDIEIRGNKS